MEDLYPSLTASSVSHDASVGLAVASVVAVPPLLLVVIWFERFGSDKKRTLINMMATKVCWINLLILYTVRAAEIVRFTAGPLPKALCCFQVPTFMRLCFDFSKSFLAKTFGQKVIYKLHKFMYVHM
jgi:hypothetical protein